MNKRFLLTTFFFFLNFSLTAQSLDSKILLSVGDDDVTVGEFLRVYNKNLNLVQDQSQKDIGFYLDLYLNFKLKLKEARYLGYPDRESFKSEFSSYKNQLSDSYLNNKEATKFLIDQAYDRTLNEVKAQHVLIRTNSKKDTLFALEEIRKFKNLLQNEDFNKLKEEFHDGKNIFVEDLGYFSAFKMVYSFENAAFNTPVGTTSDPFKTKFGYHVVKVLDKRPSRGKVQVAHIMLNNTTKKGEVTPQKRIEELHKFVLDGDSFEELAKKYSDDKSSSIRGGIMNPFGSGDINSEIFVEAAFNLKTIGDISDPVQTKYGWHILKLISKTPVANFDKIKVEIERKVKRDSRSQIIRKNLIQKLKDQYNIISPNLKSVSRSFKRNDNSNLWLINDQSQGAEIFLQIESKIYTNNDFLEFLNKNFKSYNRSKSEFEFLISQYAAFASDALINYKRDNLINENQDYAYILKEYEEGLLLFEIMQDKIWDTAKNDSLGLRSYYEDNSSKFKSNSKLIGTVVSSNKKRYLKHVINMWKDGINDDLIFDNVKNKSSKLVFTTGEFDLNDKILPENKKFDLGITEIFKKGEEYIIIKVDGLRPEQTLSFENAKGLVISEYQSYLEQNWINELRNKYEVFVDQMVLDELKLSLK